MRGEEESGKPGCCKVRLKGEESEENEEEREITLINIQMFYLFIFTLDYTFFSPMITDNNGVLRFNFVLFISLYFHQTQYT